jgi:hypothetical protein
MFEGCVRLGVIHWKIYGGSSAYAMTANGAAKQPITGTSSILTLARRNKEGCER